MKKKMAGAIITGLLFVAGCSCANQKFSNVAEWQVQRSLNECLHEIKQGRDYCDSENSFGAVAVRVIKRDDNCAWLNVTKVKRVLERDDSDECYEKEVKRMQFCY